MRLAFMLGTGRCGSTLLEECACRHPDIGFISNLDNRFPGFWDAHNNAIYRRLPAWLAGRNGPTEDLLPAVRSAATLAEKLSIRFAPSEAYTILRREVSSLLVDPVRDPSRADWTPWIDRRLRVFFLGRAKRQGRPVFLHKFTGWPRAGLLVETFPESRFIHVVRDGRAVASSLLQQPWWRGYSGPEGWGLGPLSHAYAEEWEASGRSFVVLAGIEWKLLMDAFDGARETVPPEQWLEVRYEDFLEDPTKVLRGMLEFLGLDWRPDLQAALDGMELRPARRAAYRRELAPGDVEALETSLRSRLEEMGYLPDASGRSDPTGL